MGQREDGRCERPILFNGDMVRAIREGRKTETRRPVKPQPTSVVGCPPSQEPYNVDAGFLLSNLRSPFGRKGGLLWVKETWAALTKGSYYFPHECDELDDSPKDIFETYGAEGVDVIYRANGENYPERWRPSIHMPRWASRILLEVTEVRVERIQAITEEGAKVEGVEPFEHIGAAQQLADDSGRTQGTHPHTVAFASLWDGIYHGQGMGWCENPWVWVYTFKALEGWR